MRQCPYVSTYACCDFATAARAASLSLRCATVLIMGVWVNAVFKLLVPHSFHQGEVNTVPGAPLYPNVGGFGSKL
jgi:hypothetical protein